MCFYIACWRVENQRWSWSFSAELRLKQHAVANAVIWCVPSAAENGEKAAEVSHPRAPHGDPAEEVHGHGHVPARSNTESGATVRDGGKGGKKKSEYFGSDPSQLFMSYWGGNYRLMDCPAAHKSILIGHQSFGIRLGRERRKPNRFHFDFGISAVLHKFTLCGIRFFFCACPFSAAKSECWKSQIKLNNRLQ